MIFQQPLAWFGLAAIAVPVVVHWLGRRRARRMRFPTLQFLDASRQLPVRRARLTDAGLLALRIAILAIAVGALAQPLWLSGARSDALDRVLARAVIVDRSLSMQRSGVANQSGFEQARREAQQLAAEATSSRVWESEMLGESAAGAVDWLATQPGRHEVVVVSDFQSHALSPDDIARIRRDVGVRLIRVDLRGSLSPLPAGRLDLLTSDAERPQAEVTERAAAVVAGNSDTRADRPVSVVFPSFAGRTTLRDRATPLTQPWMFDVVATATREFARMGLAGAAPDIDARTADGRLLIFATEPPATFTSAALVLALTRALSPMPPAAEMDPVVIADAELRGWERLPAPALASSADAIGASDARWLWAAVLVLLAIETWVRRRRPASPQAATASEVARVA